MGGLLLSALDRVVAAASLAEVGASPRRSFTASKREGVLAQRRASSPWGFCVSVLQAGLCVSPSLVATARAEEHGDEQRVTIDIRAELEDWSWIDLAGLLEASLLEAQSDPAPQRWRARIGQAINGALGSTPRWLELHTPAGARRWVWGGEASRGADPYRVQRIATEVPTGGFTLRVAVAAKGLAGLISRWRGRNAPEVAVARAWSAALGTSIDDVARGVVVHRLDPAVGVQLGDAVRWWPCAQGGLHLRRDGVRVFALGEIVAAMVATPLHGDVEASRVGLDADGRRPRVDAAFHEMVAWLDAEANAAPTMPPAVLADSRGMLRTTETLSSVDEVVFRWPHQPGPCRAVLTPQQLVWLRTNTEATFVPDEVLRTASDVPRVDLTALREGSVGPVDLGDVQGCRAEAYLHRHPVATLGVIETHAFGRVLLRMPAPEFPGVTVVVTLPPEPSYAARAESYANAARERVGSRTDALTSAVLGSISDDQWRLRVPWVAHRWDGLDPQTLELRYVPHGEGVRLAWRAEPLLAMTAAHGRDGAVHSVEDALIRVRDVGGIVVADPGTVWGTLESSEPAWTPWTLSARGEAVLSGLIGEPGLWRMPMVPEAQQRPASVREQPHLRSTALRVRELKAALRGSGHAARWARDALLAHALWARAGDEDPLGLDGLALLTVYDPRAADPRRWVPLADVGSANVCGVVPPGAGHRGLANPVLEANPAVAHALVELGLVPATATRPAAAQRVEQTPSARREVWMRHPVVDPLCAGALTLQDGPAGVELWSEGLRVRTLVLPPPHALVSGRVWLQGSGVSVAQVRRVLIDAAEAMRPAVAEALLLADPRTARARALRELLAAMPENDPPPRPRKVAATLGSDPLGATLRFALGRASIVEVSGLSWALVRDDQGLQRVRLGGRHPLVRAATREGATPSSTAAAALAVLLQLHRVKRLDAAEHDEAVARVLAALA